MLAHVIEMRAVSPDDWEIWRMLRLAALAEAPYAFGSLLADWQGRNDREDRWRSRLSIPGSFNVVAEIDDQPVGMASGVPTIEDSVVELISMWIAPTAREALETRWCKNSSDGRGAWTHESCVSTWRTAIAPPPGSTSATDSATPVSKAT
jgi:hypothetical protein